MEVYHASMVRVERPDVYHSRKFLDFGQGFYVTTLKDQAVKYAQRFIRRGKEAWLNIYELDEDFMSSSFIIREFEKYDANWLDFVVACRKGIVRLVTDREKGETMPAIPAGYVDLGLASGTLWKDKNEEGGFYTYEQAIAKFGSDLPTKEQLEELKSSCKWTWNGSGYRVEGPSGGSIVLPAAGWRRCSGSVGYVGSNGYYWSSTPYGSDYAWYLYFYSSEVGMYNNDRCNGRSVRLVR